MDKGIRAFARNHFVEQNERRRRGLMDNTAFRKGVIATLMEQFGITLASAATHYNDAFKFIKEQNSELVSGLGRPEDKKGGRKKKVAVAEPMTSEETAAILLESMQLEGASPRLMAELEEAEA